MKLDENRYERLKLLAENLSMAYDESRENAVLIDAVESELGRVFDYLSLVFNSIKLSDENNDGARLMLEILRINGDDIENGEVVNTVIGAISKPFGAYTCTTLGRELDRAVSGAYIDNTNETSVIRACQVSGFKELSALAVVLSNFVPPLMCRDIEGNGCSFSQWDSFSACWYQLDKLRLPFSFLDKIQKKELISNEQL